MRACETSADTLPALWELHSPNFTLMLSVYCLYFSCLTPSPYPVSFWAANFNLKLDWADRMQIPRGKTQKLMNSYVKSILHHREKVTSARQKPTRLKRQGFSRVISLLYILFTVSHPSEIGTVRITPNCRCKTGIRRKENRGRSGIKSINLINYKWIHFCLQFEFFVFLNLFYFFFIFCEMLTDISWNKSHMEWNIPG